MSVIYHSGPSDVPSHINVVGLEHHISHSKINLDGHKPPSLLDTLPNGKTPRPCLQGQITEAAVPLPLSESNWRQKVVIYTDQLDIRVTAGSKPVGVFLLGVKIAVFVEFPNSAFDHKGRRDVIPGPTDTGSYTSQL
jgi:hypothetical protein